MTKFELRACSRRTFLAFAAAGATAASFGTVHAADKPAMTLYKSPTCGCCTAWAKIVEEAGYSVKVAHLDDLTSVKRQAGVPQAMEACHTALIDGYVVEGHVPVEAIDKLLAEKPPIGGIAVPGMPEGSPGMGDDPTAQFDVLAFGKSDGSDSYLFYRAGQ